MIAKSLPVPLLPLLPSDFSVGSVVALSQPQSASAEEIEGSPKPEHEGGDTIAKMLSLASPAEPIELQRLKESGWQSKLCLGKNVA